MGGLCVSNQHDQPKGRSHHRVLSEPCVLDPVGIPEFLLPLQEDCIRKHEEYCPFSKLDVATFSSSLKEEAMSHMMSTYQLKRVFQRLSISKQHLEDPDSQFFRFLVSLRVGKLFDMFKVLLAGLLLSKGKVEDKARALFEHFDVDQNGAVDLDELKHIISSIAQMAVDHIPLLAVGEVRGEFLSLTQLTEYQRSLRPHIPELVQKLAEQLLKGSPGLDKEQFVRLVTQSQLRSLLWTGHLREALLKMGGPPIEMRSFDE